MLSKLRDVEEDKQISISKLRFKLLYLGAHNYVKKNYIRQIEY